MLMVESWDDAAAKALVEPVLTACFSADLAVRHRQITAATEIDRAFVRRDLAGLRRAVGAFHEANELHWRHCCPEAE